MTLYLRFASKRETKSKLLGVPGNDINETTESMLC